MTARALLDRAWDARTDGTRLKHARAAAAIDPDALDAYVLIAQSTPDRSEALAALTLGAARGRLLWAAEMKRPAQSWFWDDHDTRPFMRVLHLLALALWEGGDRTGAIREAKTLLRLNRNDNQGIRELLHAWYPAVGDWDSLGKLLRRYGDDWSVSHHYTRWLLAFRGGEETASALADALEANPHVARFLADDGDELADMGFVTVGSPGEAAAYAVAAREGWLAVPDAIACLTRDADLATRQVL